MKCKVLIRIIPLSLLALLALQVQSALAIPKGAFEVDADDLFTEKTSAGKFTCGEYKGKFVPGKKITENGETFFYPTSLQLKKVKKQRASGEGDPAALDAKIATLTDKVTNGKAACKGGPDDGGGGGGGDPTPTPTPDDGNFDDDGNVTAAGKSAFGIPSSLNCNYPVQGKAIHNAFCTGCHAERTGKTYNYYRQAIAASPMLYDEGDVDNQDLCDLTAYLNRFNQ